MGIGRIFSTVIKVISNPTVIIAFVWVFAYWKIVNLVMHYKKKPPRPVAKKTNAPPPPPAAEGEAAGDTGLEA